MKNELVWGIHTVRAIVDHKLEEISVLWLDKSKRREWSDWTQPLEEEGLAIHWRDSSTLTRVVGHSQHQGMVVQCRTIDVPEAEQLLPAVTGQQCFLILEHLQDPQNLGACLRSAAAFQVDGVILTVRHSASVTPLVRKVASGGAELVKIYQTNQLASFLSELKTLGVWVTALAPDSSSSLEEWSVPYSNAIVMGAEGQGLRALTRTLCDFQVKIPMNPNVRSLNVSVATGIVLHHVQYGARRATTH